MKRLLVLASVLAMAAPLAAASVGGKVNFIMKREQTPVINETVVWLEPASGKAAFWAATSTTRRIPRRSRNCRGKRWLSGRRSAIC